MGSTGVHHEHNLSTFSSQDCISLADPFFEVHTFHPCIFVQVVCDWQCIQIYASKTPQLLALVNHHKFQFVTVGRVCASEDCYFIHGFLWTAKLLESVVQRAIWSRSIIHTSLVSVVNVFRLILAKSWGRTVDIHCSAPSVSALLFSPWVHLNFMYFLPFQRDSQPSVATKSGLPIFFAWAPLLWTLRLSHSISPPSREQLQNTALVLLPLLDHFRTICAFLRKDSCLTLFP